MKVLDCWFEGVVLVICYGHIGDERMALINLNEIAVWKALRILRQQGFTGWDRENIYHLGLGEYAQAYTKVTETETIQFWFYDQRFFTRLDLVKEYYRRKR